MMIEFGRAGWIDKARRQPDKVRMVLEKVRTDGLAATLEAVRSKLDQPLPLGYCNVGVVLEAGRETTGFAAGERVVSNGKHAELVAVPARLCARVPDAVSDEQASFTILGAIGLQGLRLLEPTLGESIVVLGLGPIGLLCVQMLHANGCRVLAADFDTGRLELAKRFGAQVVNLGAGEDVLAAAERFSRGAGVDGVLVTASTKSSEPLLQAARMCRKRGRIVLVGVTGMELGREELYRKELKFQVSCSYGPGRYDPAYEEQGHDYPIGYVRWTEQRNFEAVLGLLASGRLDVAPLVSHRFPLERAKEAYDLLASAEPSLGIVLGYPESESAVQAGSSGRTVDTGTRPPSHAEPGIAFIGAGNYASRVLAPAFRRAGARLQTAVSAGGVSAAHLARRNGFVRASTDTGAVISDPAIQAVVIATRHDQHGRQVVAALREGKHVFCEKPLCLDTRELAEIEAAAGSSLLMVGFNRRFAPHVVAARRLLDGLRGPKAFVMTVNAGRIPEDHWTRDPVIGGGRIVGEACHFIDLLRHLAGCRITRHAAFALRSSDGRPSDSATLTLEFADGSSGVVHYLTEGHRGFPKERLDVFSEGRTLQLDNFRRLRTWGWGRLPRTFSWRQDKGQSACVQAFMDSVRHGGPAPIPLQEILEVSRVSIECQRAASSSP
jgi:predicted dehydrogenase/threonine dehydrogenase-like Zn-dependent dehydrogenase